MANGRGHTGPEGDWVDRRRELAARREARRRRVRRRRVRRRRLLAAGVLALGLFVGGAAIAGLIGRGAAGPHHASAAHRGAKRPRHGGGGDTAGPVRNSSPQPGWRPHTGPVPILEYHVLGDAPADAPYPDLYVARPDFRHQLEWLDGHGYEAVTLEQVQDAWYRAGTLPPKPVVISFDDGYRPQFTFALPQLRKHGWAGVLNLKAEGSDLYRSNVEAMVAAGWEVASHTIDHSDLTTLGPAALRRELAGSRRILRRDYGVPVKNFCYPSGRYDETVIAAVEAAGYEGATTEVRGYASRDKPFELARYEILGSDGVAGMAADLASGA